MESVRAVRLESRATDGGPRAGPDGPVMKKDSVSRFEISGV